jgi:hypothetical protein
MIKLIVLSLLIVVVAAFTLPYWGSCDLRGDVCSNWCGIRHFNSGIKAAACRAECVGERLNCLASEAGMGSN